MPQAPTDAPPYSHDEGALMGDAKPVPPQDQVMAPSGLTGNEANAHELPATERFELADTQVPHELPANNPS
ncbi:hypothetical protein KEM56_006242 [Ascosphaera pollenicola]|nr:hypothetical protein KEM56_006242 [Ascosphaera pollenicola]